MIVVYTLGGRTIGGHTSFAFTGLGDKSFYFSWLGQTGKQVKFKTYKHSKYEGWGSWGDIIHRVEIPTREDGNVGLDVREARALKWFKEDFKGREAKEFCEEWNYDYGEKRSYTRLYSKYNCSEIANKFLIAAGATDYDPSCCCLPVIVWTPWKVACLAKDIRKGVLAELNNKPVLNDTDHLDEFFKDDPVYNGAKDSGDLLDGTGDHRCILPW
jgi:hypothetical protein